MNNKLAEKLGTWRTNDKVIKGVTEIDHLLDTSDKKSSAIQIFSPLVQGLYEENKGHIPVIWSEALELMT